VLVQWRLWIGMKWVARSQRSLGTSLIAERPSRSSCQKAWAELAPPGRRQPMPMIAMGSWVLGVWDAAFKPGSTSLR